MMGRLMSLALLACLAASPASALSSSECSVKYQAAKQAGTLGGQKWNEFRRAQCGAAQTSTTVTNPLDGGAAPAPAAAPRTSPPAGAPPRPRSDGYPGAVDPRYASESPGKARMHTCLDSYRARKASGAGAGMGWIEKGGGYYSACNRHLKGGA